MKKRRGILGAHCFLLTVSLLTAHFLVMPVWAGGVDDKIKNLEDELAKLKTQQLELRKEATAAADALPTFSYRPGRGMTITAADKSWAFTVSHRMQLHMYNHLDGEDARSGMTSGEIFARRIRFYTTYCWSNCFYETVWSIDSDSGNIPLELQDQEFNVHFEQMNPWLPILSMGIEAGARNGIYRSSSSAASLELGNVISNSSVTSTGKHTGIGLVWADVPMGPGTFSLEGHYVASALDTGDGGTRDSDRKGFIGFIGSKPFSNTKSKWIEGLEMGLGVQLQSIDSRGDSSTDTRRQRLRTNERRGRLVLIDASAIGDGYHYFMTPGVRWRIGPYTARFTWEKSNWRGERDIFAGMRATGWQAAHEVFLWSPKGFLTGSSSTPGSVQVGFMFERADMRCADKLSEMGSADCAPGSGNFNSNHMYLRELTAWYWISRSFRVGMWWNWWTAANTPVREQIAMGCSSNTSAAANGGRKDCDWHSINLGMNFHW